MATSEKFQQYLECQICLEMYKEPKSLECRHVFCGHCLVSLYRSRVGQRDKGIICPVCRHVTILPNKSSSVEDRVNSLPSDFNMRGLAEITAQKMKQEIEENTLQCDEHGEVLTMYCRDHDKAVCLVCAYSAGHHRNCAGVITVKDEAKTRRESLRMLGVKTSLETDRLRSVLVKNKRSRDRIVENKKKIISNITSYYERLHQELRVLERTLLAYTEMKIDKELSYVDRKIESEMKHISARESHFDLISHLLKTKSDLEVCMSLKGTFQIETEDLSRHRPFKSVPNLKHKMNLNADVETIRRLKPCPVRFVYNELSPFVDHMFQIPTRFDDDTVIPDIKCLSLMGTSENVLFISDAANKKMKALCGFEEPFAKRFQLSLAYVPYDISRLTEHEVVGVNPEHKKVLFFEIGDEIHLRKKVPSRKFYKCLTKLDNELIAVSDKPPSFDVLSLDGKLLQIILLTFPLCPVSVSVTAKGYLAVADQISKSISILDTGGHCLGGKPSPNTRSLRSVSGVCCDEHGNVFIVDPQNGGIVVVEERFDSDVAVNVTNDITLSHSASSLIIDSDSSIFLADGNVIKVFKLAYG